VDLDQGRHPSEELNAGAESAPRLAASAIVLRDGPGGPETLLVQRNPASRFMGGVWVFPGGAVSGDETPPDAARRELHEEAGLRLAPAADMVPFARLITPVVIRIRFDTWFFVARAPQEQTAAVDGEECVDLRWMGARAALDAGARGELELVIPTIKLLERLAGAASAGEALELARSEEVVAILPRVLLDGDEPRVVLPGEPGYDD